MRFLQLRHQPLEVGAVAEWVEGGLGVDLICVAKTARSGPVQPFHRPVGRFLTFSRGDPRTGPPSQARQRRVAASGLELRARRRGQVAEKGERPPDVGGRAGGVPKPAAGQARRRIKQARPRRWLVCVGSSRTCGSSRAIAFS